MALSRIGPAGDDFTVSLFNGNCDKIEDTEIHVIGRGVVEGLLLVDPGGLEVEITDGILTITTTKSASSIPNKLLPAASTRWVWIDEALNVTLTTTSAYPGGNVVCLGNVTTDGSDITSISYDGRMDVCLSLQEVSQAGSYVTVSVTGGSTKLTPAQYGCRILEFVGVLTSDQTIVVPNNPGFEWTLVNSTTGAHTLTVSTENGTGIAVASGKTCKLWADGTDVRRATPDV